MSRGSGASGSDKQGASELDLEAIEGRARARRLVGVWTTGETEAWGHVDALIEEVRRLRAKIAAYESPGGWRVLHDRDARRITGDPFVGVGGSALSKAKTQGEG